MDGHGGSEIMEMIKEKALDLFIAAFETEREEQFSRKGRIRQALKQMHWQLNILANNRFNKVKSNLIKEGWFEYRDEIRLGTQKKRKQKYPCTMGEPGSCIAVAIIDEQESVLHTSSLGDCEVHIRHMDGMVTLASIVHDSNEPAEMARVMLDGAYITPGGSGMDFQASVSRLLGTMMCSRFHGNNMLASLRPETNKACRAPPALQMHQLDRTTMTHVLVSSDGMSFPSWKKLDGRMEDVETMAKQWIYSFQSDNWDDQTLVVAQL